MKSIRFDAPSPAAAALKRDNREFMSTARPTRTVSKTWPRQLERRLDSLPKQARGEHRPWGEGDAWPRGEAEGALAKYASAFRIKGAVGALPLGTDVLAALSRGFAVAAIRELEPVHPVTKNGQTFEVADIKALIALALAGTYGTGRALTPSATDAGLLHIALGNLAAGTGSPAILEDRTMDYQVWNQPLRGYGVTRTSDVTPEEAGRLSTAEQLEAVTALTWAAGDLIRPGPVRFVSVDTRLDLGPGLIEGGTGRQVAQVARTLDLSYLLSVDEAGSIRGGTFVGDEQSRRRLMLWAPGAQPAAGAFGLSYKRVRALADASAEITYNGHAGLGANVRG